ncbi:MAG: glutamine-hydrolyzing carbamoyl-phosphate synthase small subunit [Betaproteobacteria bacterium]|nr:glutamine-hydrolyzing carbamoyl-phosphate synthase small subunit [Betaproteobacteria bacterium]
MANPIRIAIAGAGGRMGQVLIASVLAAPDLTLAAALDVPGASSCGHDAGAPIGRATGVVVGSDVDEALARSDVLIDFTRPEGTLAHAAACARRGVALVAGTTGLTPAHKAELATQARTVPIVHAPNMSVGVNVLADLVARAARALGAGYDIEVVEMHHRHKVDAPSGTALMLGEAAASGAGIDLATQGVYAREGVTGERKAGTIGFATLRGGDVVGEHTVVFAGTGERVELSHRATSRQMFADGALRAARFAARAAARRAPALHDARAGAATAGVAASARGPGGETRGRRRATSRRRRGPYQRPRPVTTGCRPGSKSGRIHGLGGGEPERPGAPASHVRRPFRTRSPARPRRRAAMTDSKLFPPRTPAILALADGTVFHGRSIGAAGQSSGEVVFNTAMTGYQEILTDPSYAGQIITFTNPHIGNVGVTHEDAESRSIYAAGLVIRDLPSLASNWRSEGDLASWLAAAGVVGIADIDTRRLTRVLRDRGAQNGCIVAAPSIGTMEVEQALAAAREAPSMAGQDLAKVVSTTSPYEWTASTWALGQGYRPAPAARHTVVAYDFGVKHNILRMLVERGCRVHVVPAQTPARDVLALKPDGVFLSNGPGDPEPCDYAIGAIREIVGAGVPTFGICLGHQLLGLAAGARTVKMKFGHHGANHPVLDLDTGQVMITSQNHGFAVDASSLPANVRVTHVSLFDRSLQGIAYTDRPAFSFQGHPEASPGPHDVGPLFDRFVKAMESPR